MIAVSIVVCFGLLLLGGAGLLIGFVNVLIVMVARTV
jgi:hypothetical protein